MLHTMILDHIADEKGILDQFVRALLDRGASVNTLDSKGNSALIYAAMGGHKTVVTMLLQAGADASIVMKDIHAPTGRFLDAAGVASIAGHKAVAKLIKSSSSVLSASGQWPASNRANQ